MPSYQPDLEQRFWIRVKMGDGCWEWTGAKTTAGYGQIESDGKRLYAHRVGWTIFNGSIPDGLLVCHHCDNRKCVRPDHLFLGTDKDNLSDMSRKDRVSHGDRHPVSKLTEAIVKEMRSSDEPSTTIAQRCGVGVKSVNMARSGRTWRRVQAPPKPAPGQVRGERSCSAKLTDAIVSEMRLASGTNEEIGRRYGVSDVTAYNARVGRTWKHVTTPPVPRQRAVRGSKSNRGSYTPPAPPHASPKA